MDRKKIKGLIRALKHAFESCGIQLDRMIVFGSGASGRMHGESDLDIVIISEQFSGKDLFERARTTGRIHWELVQKFHIPLDIIAMTPSEYDSEVSLIALSAQEEGHVYKVP